MITITVAPKMLKMLSLPHLIKSLNFGKNKCSKYFVGAFIQGAFIMIGQLLRNLFPQPEKESFALLMQK